MHERAQVCQGGADRYEKHFSDFRLPKDVKAGVVLAETIGADGRRLLERIYAETRLPWLAELEVVDGGDTGTQGTPGVRGP